MRVSFQKGASRFTLEDLRRMRTRGDVTEEEYAALRRSVVEDLRDNPVERLR